MSNEYHEPVDKQVKQKDRIGSNYVLVLLNHNVHKRNSTQVTIKLPKTAQTRAKAAIISFKKMKFIDTALSNPTIVAANTIGKIQYPRTHTHWKNDIFPPNSFVFIVTTKAPPHITKNKIPNQFPLDFMPTFSTLFQDKITKTMRDKAGVVPRDPLNYAQFTISKLLYSFGITLHIEFGDDNVLELDQNIFKVSGLVYHKITMVSQTGSSRVSDCSLTYACIVI